MIYPLIHFSQFDDCYQKELVKKTFESLRFLRLYIIIARLKLEDFWNVSAANAHKIKRIFCFKVSQNVPQKRNYQKLHMIEISTFKNHFNSKLARVVY